MVKKYIEKHDQKHSFLLAYLLLGIGLTLLLNLSILILFVAVHTIFDYFKYRLNNLSRVLSIGKALQEQLLDLMFIMISITFAVYLSHKTPGAVGLAGLRALEEVRIFSFVKALPRFALIEHLLKGVVHSVKHFKEHSTKHIHIPQFGKWEVFYLQIVVYCIILILLAPAFTPLSYTDVWHNMLVEISPWHIGQH